MDRTQYQTAGGQSASKKLSLEATTPPAEVPGYRLQKFLGAGAFGQVWVGLDLNTGRSVAVKFYLHRSGVNWSLLSREVKNLVQLSADRHVVQVLEVGWDAVPPYYVMELVSGGSLEDFLEHNRPMPVIEAVDMFRKIVIGLNHCHGKGVLHCDLKPANILLSEDNEPRLADFGQSRMSHDQTPALGTLFYMAPEQADLNSTPDASWDVYAVGAILYRLLTGAPPYRDDSIVEQIDTAGSLPKRLEHYRQAIQNSPPPEGHLRGHGVDRMLGRIVNRCLAADPADRYGNAQQILQDLDRRDRIRARRPLMLLGIVGPLLLLLATCIFAARSIEHASQSTISALRSEAFGSNQLAAKFAARTLESEIERYFDAARVETRGQELRELLEQSFNDPEMKPLREIIGSSATSDAEKVAARESMLDAEPRLRIDAWLSKRLQRYQDPSGTSRRPRFATMFVTDAMGTIIGIVYEDHVERAQNSAGRNFAFRTYFHGGRKEIDRTTPREAITPLQRTHLSAAFQSTATGLWKVAVSTPIYFTDDHTRADAVFVATINLGDFQLLQSEQGANQIAVLVDARDGPMRGTVLQHPLMDARRDAGETLAGEKFQVDAALFERILEGGDVDYRDPVSQCTDGKPYWGDWIVAMQSVELPTADRTEVPGKQDEPKETADLLVLVQYRLSKVLAPVGQMRSVLLTEGATAIASILIVTLLLWILVQRSGETKTISHRAQQKDTSDHDGMTETIAV
ncbi:Serine/threonine-protein kinase PknB [Novipirellula galeiformis]|uniref:Serine/threonine-protein kinase PknB n=1 Tax=Novipirellula galeiformis TaxID=2528004 RepID=A0A5C6CJA6_9BACT|nr:protein kinase [Novipirellula galeiformis]TWU24442.1 Serine/threonine-protein kinase PknB [Novipirellula galeiformis]